MPIFVFKCAECEKVVEELRKIGDDVPPDPCPSCDATGTMKKQITAANFKIDPAAG